MAFATTYRPGTSLVHRLPAGVKLTAMVVLAVLITRVGRPSEALVALGLALAAYAVARLPWASAGQQLWPARWLLLLIAVAQLFAAGWQAAVVVVGSLATLILVAALVNLTTPATALVAAIVTACGPLRRIGVDPERVGLALLLGMRSVPVVVALAEDVRAAQLARGLQASPRAFAVPLLVRAFRHADQLGEALVARGLDD